MSQQILLVADTAFIDSATIKEQQFLSVFPRETGDGAYRSSLDDLLQRSKLQSAFYDELIPELLPVADKYMPAAKHEAGILLRLALTSITSIYTDRCIRVLHRLRQCKGKIVSAVAVEPIDGFQWAKEITQTWQLNQDVIQRIMIALGHGKISVIDQSNYPEFPKEYFHKNLIFWPQRQGLAGTISQVLSRSFGLLEKIPSIRARFQSLGLTSDRYYFAKHGFIGPFGIFQKLLNIDLSPATKQLELRENFFADIEKIVRLQFESFFSRIQPNLSKDEMSRLSLAYARLLGDWFPIGFLEGLTANLEKVAARLNNKDILGVIGLAVGSRVGVMACLSARLSGKTVIGIQHAGHYGYIEDMSYLGQLEYSLCDYFLTWGWTHIDEHLPQCRTIPAPSPKLSEQPFKADYLKELRTHSANKRDILFLSNQWHRFPHPTTGGHPRVDFIDEIKNSQEELVKAIRDSNLSIDHKPHNMKIVDLYNEHFRKLESIGGAGYRLLKTTHKGLTVDLIKTGRILLWDQLGSGALEAFTSGVPTIIYWKRMYSREAPWARDLIAGLEQSGVVHSDANTLVQEIKIYLESPEDWMNNQERKDSIEAFCQKFAQTDPRWHEKWLDLLSGNRLTK